MKNSIFLDLCCLHITYYILCMYMCRIGGVLVKGVTYRIRLRKDPISFIWQIICICIIIQFSLCRNFTNEVSRRSIQTPSYALQCNYTTGRALQCNYTTGRALQCNYTTGRALQCSYTTGRALQYNYMQFILADIVFETCRLTVPG
jgi:hypothetical protein